MPYINQQARKYFDDIVAEMPLKQMTSGELNYLFTRVLVTWVKERKISYDVLSDAIKTLECCKLEFYERVLRPYEDAKCGENGDCYGF
jgi:hypothetical protein